ncbi:MAG TPA: molybdopterin-dependent oxidoreductase [Casimicrobiaceae bacterium]|nr:molybdopterin-dependent oxidoreductase [Casimicrobiaceae bacterium]
MARTSGLAVVFLLASAWAASALADAPGAVTTALTVKGSVERELTLSVDDLKRLPVQRVDDVRSVREAGGAASSSQSARHYAGCLLRDVLERAKPVEKRRMDFRRSAVIATASDGYRVVFSWAELYLSPIGDGVLVVYERDGAPLDDSEGRIALVSLRDTRPGPRHVKWLQSIELRVLE